MLRWNSDRMVAEKCELPPWQFHCVDNSVDRLLEFLENTSASPSKDSSDFDLIDEQLQSDIFELKCKIFSYENNDCRRNSTPDGFMGDRSPIPSSERLKIRRARAAANPFEQIGRSIFINRAAVKLASLDAALGFILSKNNPQRLFGSNCLFFADLCGGPGGFSEYIIWRLSGMDKGDTGEGCAKAVRGFGLTLKDPNDDFQQAHWWSLQKLNGELPFKAVYGPEGGDVFNNGDITVERNRNALIEQVRRATPAGCGLVMGDGGFDMSGREERQEILISRILACEFACALLLLATGGHFLCKLFDISSPITATLLYVLSAFFEKISIIKPVTSRPANGERYVVGLNFLATPRNQIATIAGLLNKAADAVESKQTSLLISEIELGFSRVLPFSLVPDSFVTFLRGINDPIAFRQKVALDELLSETKDTAHFIFNTVNSNAATTLKMAEECSKLWHLPPVSQSPLSNGANTTTNRRGSAYSLASSVADWRTEKRSIPVPFRNTNNLNVAKSSFGKSRGLADSVANWRRTPAH